MRVVSSLVRLGVVGVAGGLPTQLAKRLDGLAWPVHVFAESPTHEAIAGTRLDAVLMDLATTSADPWPYLEDLCAHFPQLGVIVWARESDVADRVRALRLGADDHVAMSCDPEEVIARVEAIVRRRREGAERQLASPFGAGELEIAPGGFRATIASAALDLTRREYELLEMLAAAEGQVLRREEIYERVWGYAMVRGDRSVDVYVGKLRQKLEGVAWVAVYPHALRHRLSVRRPAHGSARSAVLETAGVSRAPPRLTDQLVRALIAKNIAAASAARAMRLGSS